MGTPFSRTQRSWVHVAIDPYFARAYPRGQPARPTPTTSIHSIRVLSQADFPKKDRSLAQASEPNRSAIFGLNVESMHLQFASVPAIHAQLARINSAAKTRLEGFGRSPKKLKHPQESQRFCGGASMAHDWLASVSPPDSP